MLLPSVPVKTGTLTDRQTDVVNSVVFYVSLLLTDMGADTEIYGVALNTMVL